MRRRILLFCMPWIEPHQAPLGLCIVKSLLCKADMHAETVHINLQFYTRILTTLGKAVADFAYRNSHVGEVIAGFILRREYTPLDPAAEGLDDFLGSASFPRDLFWQLVREFEQFTEESLAQIPLDDVAVCGFGLSIR